MSTPHHRIHRLAAAGGATLALVAALPAGASARPAPPDDPYTSGPAAVTAAPTHPQAGPAVAPNPDNRPFTTGQVLPHTNWVTATGSGGPVPSVAYDFAPDTETPRAKGAGDTSLLVPAGFAGFVLLGGLTGAGVRRRRRAKVAA
jgi:hypothetical protein